MSYMSVLHNDMLISRSLAAGGITHRVIEGKEDLRKCADVNRYVWEHYGITPVALDAIYQLR